MPVLLLPMIKIDIGEDFRKIVPIIEAITEVQEATSDVYIMPGIYWSSKFHSPEGEGYVIRFLKWHANLFMGLLESYLKKPVLLNLSLGVNMNHLDWVIESYKGEYDGLVLDFARKTPMTLRRNIAHVIRVLGDRAESMLLYGANVNPGGYSRRSERIRAKDMLSFGLGIDIIGRNHYGIPNISNIAKFQAEPKARLFDRTDYFYISGGLSSFLDKVKTSIPLDELIKSPKYYQELFNYEQINLEAMEMRRRVSNGEKLLKYWDEKKGIRDLLKFVKEAKNYVSSANLDGEILISL